MRVKFREIFGKTKIQLLSTVTCENEDEKCCEKQNQI